MISCPQTTPINYSHTDPDVARMLRVRNGDKKAFGELYERYAGRVQAVVTHMTGNPQSSEDITQEVFLRVFRSRNRYLPNSLFSTWLFTVVRNLVRNARRGQARRKEVQWCSMGGSPKDPLVEAEDRDSFAEPRCRLQAKESREVMSLAIRQLPSRQREAATLFGMQGMTYGEAAGSLGTSIIAFKSLVYRARANLRRMLAEYDDAGQLSPPLRDAIAADSPQLAPMH